MNASIAGARSELGVLLSPPVTAARYDDTVFDVSGQQADTLLHDGHAWKAYTRAARAGRFTPPTGTRCPSRG